jgi:hypothetical protein
MRELKVPLVRRWLMWAAVRLSSIARHDPRSFLSQGFGPAVKLVLIVVGAVAFLATPIVLVVLFSLLFAGLEALAWVPLWLGKRHGLVKEQVNRPRLRLPR